MLIETFKADDDIEIAYIYCNYKEPNLTAVNLVANMLLQLLRENTEISPEIITLYDTHSKQHTRPSLAECSKLLKSEVRRLSKCFIVVDALDECPDDIRESLLLELKK